MSYSVLNLSTGDYVSIIENEYAMGHLNKNNMPVNFFILDRGMVFQKNVWYEKPSDAVLKQLSRFFNLPISALWVVKEE